MYNILNGIYNVLIYYEYIFLFRFIIIQILIIKFKCGRPPGPGLLGAEPLSRTEEPKKKTSVKGERSEPVREAPPMFFSAGSPLLIFILLY